MPYANWGKRALSGLVDYVAPLLVIEIITGIFNSTSPVYSIIQLILNLLYIGWLVFNTGYLGGTTGQSYGRKIAGIKLLSISTGQPIGFGMAVLRFIAHTIDSLICFVGWLFPLWDEKRQTIADKIISTIVVDNTPDGAPQQSPSPYGY